MAFEQLLLDFILDNKWVLLGYLILGLIIYYNRKKFIVENKIFLLYKTQKGVGFINRVADKHKSSIKLLGYIGIGIGFIGMALICGFFVKGLYDLIFVPGAPPVVSPVIPGVKVPGSPIAIPFLYGILALFIVIVIHEFGHGVVARANGLKIKSTGVGLLGPIPLAFVEPDEKQLVKEQPVVQHSIFAAGPFFNVLLTAFVLLILFVAINPIANATGYADGVTFGGIQKGQPAAQYGVQKDMVYTSLNGVQINTTADFINVLSTVKPNETVSLTDRDGRTTDVVAGSNPSNSSIAYLGVTDAKTHFTPKYNNVFGIIGYAIADFLRELLFWVYVLSLGIGLANLLPLGPVDGGRMLNIALIDANGKEKGTRLWAQISWITLFVLFVLLFVPIFRAVFLKM